MGGAGKAASQRAGVGFNEQDGRERDRGSANLPERCEFDERIAESIAADRANRSAAAYSESGVHTCRRVVLWK